MQILEVLEVVNLMCTVEGLRTSSLYCIPTIPISDWRESGVSRGRCCCFKAATAPIWAELLHNALSLGNIVAIVKVGV